jgi:Rrf2 family protein
LLYDIKALDAPVRLLELSLVDALTIVVSIAMRRPDPVAISVIAGELRLPLSRVEKTIKGLARAGVVGSARGRGGGFMLLGDPSAITALDIARQVNNHPGAEVPELGDLGVMTKQWLQRHTLANLVALRRLALNRDLASA